MKPVTSWFEWLVPRERRRAERRQQPRLVAHYWDGAAPLGHDIRDISSTGLYLLTDQRWYPGTLVMMSLQRSGVPHTDPDCSITIRAKVVRSGTDGVGVTFVMGGNPAPNAVASALITSGADRKTFQRFLKRLSESSGQALIEYILLLPMLFLLVINVVNFGGFFYAWITVANAARAGADYAILGGASVGAPGQPSAASVTSVITQDISSLPNRASLQVNICQSHNGVVTSLSGTCTGILADPEASYTLMSIDVTYTYLPFIPATFKFPNLNVYATIPPATIHRQAVMRIIQ